MRLKTNSFWLKFFPKSVDAFVFRKTIYIRGSFIDPPLYRHELEHVNQYKRYGTVGFLVRYFWYNIRYGYTDNPLEKQARAAERRRF